MDGKDEDEDPNRDSGDRCGEDEDQRVEDCHIIIDVFEISRKH